MSKRIALVAAAVLSFCVPYEFTAQAQVPSNPIISGAYIYTWSEYCTNGDGTGFSFSRITANASFDAGTGIGTLNGYKASGNPPTLTSFSESGPVSITKNSITFNGTTFPAFIKVKRGVAIYISYIGTEPGDGDATCAQQGVISQ